MLTWFRRPRHKPRSTREMVRVLRAAEQFSGDTAERQEYAYAADALDRVLMLAERHSDAPTRDAFAYALGRAELDLSDKLADLIETSKDTHLLVQSVHQAQVEQGAAAGELWAAFQSFRDSLTGWRETMEHWRATVDATLASFSRSRDESREDRQLLRRDMTESQSHRARIQHTLDTELPAISAAIQDMTTRNDGQIASLTEQLQEIQRLLEIAGGHEAGG
jgi:hypothetical protein